MQVNVKGHGLVEFPDGTPPDVMRQALMKKFMPTNTGQEATAKGLDALTLGFGDELVGNLAAGGTRIKNLFRDKDVNPEDVYNQERQKFDINKERFSEKNPNLALAADVVGAGALSAATGGLGAQAALGRLAPAIANSSKFLPTAAKLGLEGANMGALQYLGTSDNPNAQSLAESAIYGGLLGGGLGAGAAKAGGALKNAANVGLDRLKTMPFLSTAQAAGSKTLQGAEDFLRQIPVLGAPLKNLTNKASEDIANKIASPYGAVSDVFSPEGVQLAKNATKEAFNKTGQYLPEGWQTKTVAKNSLDLLNSGTLQEGVTPDSFNTLDTFKKLLSDPSLNAEKLRQIRGDIYDTAKRADPLLKRGLLNLRDAATKDYEDLISQKGGAEGLMSLKNANQAKIKESQISEILKAGQAADGSFDAIKFANKFQKLPIDERARLFGGGNVKELTNAAQYAQLAKPKPFNPSGTAGSNVLGKFIAPSIGGVGYYGSSDDSLLGDASLALALAGGGVRGLSKLAASPRTALTAARGVGKGLDNPVVSALIKTLARQQGRNTANAQNQSDRQKALAQALNGVQ